MRIVMLGLKSVLMGIVCLAGGSPVLLAQDYRIYTRVSLQETATPNSSPEVIGRSLTVWHAGTVYDYMDSIGELVIFDPQMERYTIINGPYQMACTVDFGELKQYLKVARTQAREFMADMVDADIPGSARSVEKITFQLNPQFEFRPLEDSRVLHCESPHMSYEVQALAAPNPAVASAFRKYADWAAQLNFVLHHQALIPDARMQVNAKLEEKQWIPSRVTLNLKDSKGTVLIAEHSIQWELGPTDRARIMEWKKLQQQGEVKYVSFQDYQKNLLTQFSE